MHRHQERVEWFGKYSELFGHCPKCSGVPQRCQLTAWYCHWSMHLVTSTIALQSTLVPLRSLICMVTGVLVQARVFTALVLVGLHDLHGVKMGRTFDPGRDCRNQVVSSGTRKYVLCMT